MGAPFLPARNYTIRLAVLGLPLEASPTHAPITQRRCCPTARCWWQEDKVAVLSLQALTCTTLLPLHGLLLAASTAHASVTRRRCCPMAGCWWPGDLIAVSTL